MRRRSLLLVMAGVLGAVVLAPLARAADADPSTEAYFTSAVAQARSSAGVGSLHVTADLVDIARRHSAEMAANGRIYHNPNLESEVSNWHVVAENVGWGTSAEYVHKLFMDSDGHRRNILDGRVTDVGIGVVWSGDKLYVTEIFRMPETAAQSSAPPPPPPSSSPPPAPAPAPPPPVAPAPAPRPVAPPAREPAAGPAAPAPAATPAPPTQVTAPAPISVAAIDHADGVVLALHAIVSSTPTSIPRPPFRRPPALLVLVALVLQTVVGLLAGRSLFARGIGVRVPTLLSSRTA
jgi:hypothetical protein